MFVQCGLDKGARNAHDKRPSDSEDIEEPRVGKGGALAGAKILLESRLPGHPSPVDRAGHADERPGENHHVRSGFREEQPVDDRVRKQRRNGAPPGAQQERDQGSAGHIQEQDAFQVPAECEPHIVEEETGRDDDAGLVEEKIGGASQWFRGKEVDR